MNLKERQYSKTHSLPKIQQAISIYTFQSFHSIELIREMGHDPFIFGPLKESLKRFCIILEEKRPSLVLGLARSKKAQFETLSINKFHGNRTIDGQGRDAFPLHVPSSLPEGVETAGRPSDSFCNWTAYKLAEYSYTRGLKFRLMFAHASLKSVKSIIEAAEREFAR